MEAEPVQKSLLLWMMEALGFPYLVLLPLAGALCFVLALVVVIRGRGPMAAASLILIVHVPLLIGVFAAIQGGIASYSAIAMSSGNPQASEVASGISTSLFAPLVGMLLMTPSYAVAAIGGFIRCLIAKAETSEM